MASKKEYQDKNKKLIENIDNLIKKYSTPKMWTMAGIRRDLESLKANK